MIEADPARRSGASDIYKECQRCRRNGGVSPVWSKSKLADSVVRSLCARRYQRQPVFHARATVCAVAHGIRAKHRLACNVQMNGLLGVLRERNDVPDVEIQG